MQRKARLQCLLGCLVLAVAPLHGLSREQALEAVDRFMAGWNSRDPAVFAATLHYPHVRPAAGGGERVYPTPESYAATIDFDRVLATGWRMSRFDSKRVVHLGKAKAHVAGRYTRYREDGSTIWSNQVTYVVTQRGDSIGVQGRFAAGIAGAAESDLEESREAAIEVVTVYLDAFNHRDEEAWVATFQFPHVRLAGDSATVWKKPKDYTNQFDFETFAKRYDWDHTTWDSIEAVQVSANGVNVALTATRYDREGKKLHSFDTYYLVTREGGRWGIRARSSFAPP